MKKFLSRSKLLLLSGLLFVGLVGGLYWRSAVLYSGIRTYHEQRDRAFILKLFHDNWHWLIPEGSSFSPEYFLDHRAPTKEPEDEGIEKIMVIYEHGKPIGFISYYTQSFYKARIHFIAIDKNYRGRGYGDQLMNYALDDLKKLGITLVQLITRLDNTPARTLYTKLGFREYWRDDTFIRFEKNL